MSALQLSGCHHLLFANSTVFVTLNYFQFLVVNLILILASPILSKLESNKREVFLQTCHELSELEEPGNINIEFVDCAEGCSSDNEVSEYAYVQASDQNKLEEVDRIYEVDAHVHGEFEVYHFDLAFV